MTDAPTPARATASSDESSGACRFLRTSLAAALSIAIAIAGLAPVNSPALAGSEGGGRGGGGGPHAPSTGDVAVQGDLSAGSWLVTFKDDATTEQIRGLRLAAQQRGGVVGEQWQQSVVGFVVAGDAPLMKQLAARPGLAAIESNDLITASATVQSPATWGLDRTDQRDLPLDGRFETNEDGAGVRVYVLDTGIRSTHTEFGSRVRVSEGRTWIVDGRGSEDCSGHGTHVAGTIAGSTYGIAQQAYLVPMRILDCDGAGDEAGLITALDFLANNAVLPAVVNLSLGGSSTSSVVDAAIQSVIDAGVTVVAAAGNYSDDACRHSPGRVPRVITVAASTPWDARAVFSSYGSCIDLFAPGVDITSAWAASDTSTQTLDGTSMATPHVAGVAALALGADPSATPDEVANLLVSTATPNRLSGELGSPDLLLHSGRTSSDLPIAAPPCTLDSNSSGELANGAIVGASPQFSLDVNDIAQACLGGPTAANFDLLLQRLDASGRWKTVDSSWSSDSAERLDHTASASGVYRWGVASVFGTGRWTISWRATPTTSLQPIGTSTDGRMTARFSSTDSQASFRCGLDGGVRVPCNSPQGFSMLSEGSHTLRVWAVDSYGNFDPSPAQRSFRVDLPSGDELFVDVDADNMFTDQIGVLARAGITRGCNPPVNDEFCPADAVTRGEMAAFLVRALGLPASSTNYFTDDNSSIFEANIQAVRKAGVTRGCNPPVNDEFCPDDSVTREQMAAFLVRAGLAN